MSTCYDVYCGEGGCVFYDGRPQCFCPPLDKADILALGPVENWPRPDSELRCNRTIRNPILPTINETLLTPFKSGDNEIFFYHSMAI